MHRLIAWWRRFLGLKTKRELAAEMAQEPEIRRARRAIRKADRILHEIELTERGAKNR